MRVGLEVVCLLSGDDFSFGIEWTATKVAKLSLNKGVSWNFRLYHFVTSSDWNLNWVFAFCGLERVSIVIPSTKITTRTRFSYIFSAILSATELPFPKLSSSMHSFCRRLQMPLSFGTSLALRLTDESCVSVLFWVWIWQKDFWFLSGVSRFLDCKVRKKKTGRLVIRKWKRNSIFREGLLGRIRRFVLDRNFERELGICNFESSSCSRTFAIDLKVRTLTTESEATELNYLFSSRS